MHFCRFAQLNNYAHVHIHVREAGASEYAQAGAHWVEGGPPTGNNFVNSGCPEVILYYPTILLLCATLHFVQFYTTLDAINSCLL